MRLAPGGSEVTVASGSQQGWAGVAVRDDGPGTAPEDHERIFDRFGRTGTRGGAGQDGSQLDGSDHDGHGLGWRSPGHRPDRPPLMRPGLGGC